VEEAPPRVVITHDFMETYGGAERLTQEMAEAFPDAPVVTLLARDSVVERMGLTGRVRAIGPSREWMYKHYRLLAPAWGPIADLIRLPQADVVLSSSYAYAHRMRSPEAAPVVCYCHSPLRFAWSMTEDYRDKWAPGGLRARTFEMLAATTRASDRRAARRIVSYLTSSEYVADQVRRFYHRNVEVIGVPIDTDHFTPAPNGGGPDDYFLLVGRLLEPYKKVGITVEAFRRMGRRLLIAGDGPAMDELRATAPPNVELLGYQGDDALVELMRGCRATIFPSRDDFGLVPLEVMACGRPVIAYGEGGALHTVVEGKTGSFIHEQTPEAIVEAVEAFDPAQYDPTAIRAHAEQWDRMRFRERIVDAVQRAYDLNPIGDRRLDDRRRGEERRLSGESRRAFRERRRREDRRAAERRARRG
jgi:glycosyltransferase involved in cell wall biosynthesis